MIDPASPVGFIGSVADINNAGTIAAGGGAALLVRQGDMPAPDAPASLTAVPHLPTWQQPWNAITLSWTNSSDFTIDYTIERREQGQADSTWSVIRSNWSPTSMWDMEVGLGVTYDYLVRARGLAGFSDCSNIATATAPSDPVDGEDPVVAITKPADGASVSGRVKIRAEATDNVAVTYMDITISSNYSNERLCSGGGPILECTWNTRKLENGIYTVQVFASDNMGNGGYHSITVTLGGDTGGGDPFALLVLDIAMQARVRRGVSEVTGTVTSLTARARRCAARWSTAPGPCHPEPCRGSSTPTREARRPSRRQTVRAPTGWTSPTWSRPATASTPHAVT